MQRDVRIEWVKRLDTAARGVKLWTSWLQGSVDNSQVEDWRVGLRRIRSEIMAIEELLDHEERHQKQLTPASYCLRNTEQ